MTNEKDFCTALNNKKIPILVLDQKWHRLFAIHGKSDVIKGLEERLNSLLARQGKLNTELKELKKIKSQRMEDIVQNMNDTSNDKRMEDNKRLIDEINQKIDAYEDELLELPNQIRDTNETLMLECMDYFYEKIRINKQESAEIEAWINQVRIDLKKNVIRKQNRDINNREIYAYLHDIFGPEVINLFDIQYNEGENL